jgi:DNA-binding transcriptional regulator YiaG
MSDKHVDFEKVEALRKHMMLTVNDMAGLMGVSRMTYYSWVRGATPRPGNIAGVKLMLRRLLAIMTEHSWPTQEVIIMSQPERVAYLKELLDQQQ